MRFTGRLTASATRLACQRSQNLDTPQARNVTKRGEDCASAKAFIALGTARVKEGGAPELLDKIATTIFGPGTGFPPPVYLTHITIDKVGGVGPRAS